MPSDRVLIEIATAANLAGVQAAKAGIQGFSDALTVVGPAAGIFMAVGKSMIDIADKHESAERGLTQAVEAYNSSLKGTRATTVGSAADIEKLSDIARKAQDSLTISTHAAKIAQLGYTDAVRQHGTRSEAAYKASLHLQDANIGLRQAQESATDATNALAAAQSIVPAKAAGSAIQLKVLQRQVEEFIVTNRRYVSDQAEVIDSFAKLTRSGLSQSEVQKDMNRAVDIAALKNISLTEATDILVKAESGRFKALLDLGIASGKYTDVQGNLINGTKDVAKALAEVDVASKDGRKSISDLKQASNDLGNSWQTIANENGPALEGAVAGALGKTSDFLNFLRNSDWRGASEFLVTLAQGWHGLTIEIDDATNALEKWMIQNGITTMAGSKAGSGGKFGGNRKIGSGSGVIDSSVSLRQRGFGGNQNI